MVTIRSAALDPIKLIISSPIQEDTRTSSVTSGNRDEFDTILAGAAFPRHGWSDHDLVFANIRCEEHGRMELVPMLNYQHDLDQWYAVGLHPRFSIAKALIGAGQTMREARFFVLNVNQFDHSDPQKERRKLIKGLLQQCSTPEEFPTVFEPFLFINLYSQGRRYRVTNAFKEKFKAKNFTVEDFFDQRSQELRRLILRRGVTVKDILGRLKLIAEDEEGKIYELESPRERYLYVICPSTGQEYLLGIPFWKPGSRWPDRPELKSPKEARRWTFRLPIDAEFAKEA